MTIIGVAQPGFDGVELGYDTKVFIPIMMQEQVLVVPMKMPTDRRGRWVNEFGRWKPGVSITQVNASLQPLMHSMLEMEVKEAAFNHASAYDREQFLKCWMDVLPGSQGRSYTRRGALDAALGDDGHDGHGPATVALTVLSCAAGIFRRYAPAGWIR